MCLRIQIAKNKKENICFYLLFNGWLQLGGWTECSEIRTKSIYSTSIVKDWSLCQRFWAGTNRWELDPPDTYLQCCQKILVVQYNSKSIWQKSLHFTSKSLISSKANNVQNRLNLINRYSPLIWQHCLYEVASVRHRRPSKKGLPDISRINWMRGHNKIRRASQINLIPFRWNWNFSQAFWNKITFHRKSF